MGKTTLKIIKKEELGLEDYDVEPVGLEEIRECLDLPEPSRLEDW